MIAGMVIGGLVLVIGGIAVHVKSDECRTKCRAAAAYGFGAGAVVTIAALAAAAGGV